MLSDQLLAVADCASRLRRLSKALDVNDLRLEDTASTSQELVRLHVVGLGLDIKEGLLEACGLVLLANTLLDPHASGQLLLPYLDVLFPWLVQVRPCAIVSRTDHRENQKNLSERASPSVTALSFCFRGFGPIGVECGAATA